MMTHSLPVIYIFHCVQWHTSLVVLGQHMILNSHSVMDFFYCGFIDKVGMINIIFLLKFRACRWPVLASEVFCSEIDVFKIGPFLGLSSL